MEDFTSKSTILSSLQSYQKDKLSVFAPLWVWSMGFFMLLRHFAFTLLSNHIRVYLQVNLRTCFFRQTWIPTEQTPVWTEESGLWPILGFFFSSSYKHSINQDIMENYPSVEKVEVVKQSQPKASRSKQLYNKLFKPKSYEQIEQFLWEHTRTLHLFNR